MDEYIVEYNEALLSTLSNRVVISLLKSDILGLFKENHEYNSIVFIGKNSSWLPREKNYR